MVTCFQGIGEVEPFVKWLFSGKVLLSYYQGWYGLELSLEAIWRVTASTSVSIFVWCATQDKSVAFDNLIFHGKILFSRCYLHLRLGVGDTFVHSLPCGLGVVASVLSWSGMSWGFPANVVELLQGWHGRQTRRRRWKIWALISLCLIDLYGEIRVGDILTAWPL